MDTGVGFGTQVGEQVMEPENRAALLGIVPTWCVQPRLKLHVEEIPDEGSIVFILGQPAAAGEGHALSKRWGIHLYPL